MLTALITVLTALNKSWHELKRNAIFNTWKRIYVLDHLGRIYLLLLQNDWIIQLITSKKISEQNMIE